MNMAKIVDRATWQAELDALRIREKAHGENLRTNGPPTAQWSRLEAGRSDDLGTGR